LGIIGGAMVLGALALLVSGGASDGGGATGALPELELISPEDGAVVPAPLQLTFRTGEPLSRGPGGWGTGQYHLHAALDGVEVMPGPADLSDLGNDRYAWMLAGVRPGVLEIRLFWSDSEHNPVAAPAEEAVTVHVEGRESGEGAGPHDGGPD
jgi:hypothetical protein